MYLTAEQIDKIRESLSAVHNNIIYVEDLSNRLVNISDTIDKVLSNQRDSLNKIDAILSTLPVKGEIEPSAIGEAAAARQMAMEDLGACKAQIILIMVKETDNAEQIARVSQITEEIICKAYDLGVHDEKFRADHT